MAQDLPMHIGARLRQLREDQKISQADMAKAAGVSVSALSQIELGVTKNPRPDTLLGIARRLGRSMESLIDPAADATQPPKGLSPQALRLAAWFDSLSEKQQRKAIGTLLLSLDAAPDDYVAQFLPPAPSIKR